ncbi:MAG: hypothetical protein PVG74_20555, partial [Desulfobacterales bacterium]
MMIVPPWQRFNFTFRSIEKFVLILLAAAFFLFFHFLTTASAFKEVKKILILFTAQSDTPAYNFIEKGIKQALEAKSDF